MSLGAHHLCHPTNQDSGGLRWVHATWHPSYVIGIEIRYNILDIALGAMELDS